MRFVSTRGRAPEVDFIGAMMAGLAPDGGLYVPTAWPELSPAEIAQFAGRPYAEVAVDILSRLAGDAVERAVLERICARVYARFDHPAVTPLSQLGPGTFLLELFHGPTLAFKDLAMQVLAGLVEYALALRGGRMTIVAATSGDTGGAAASAFAGLRGVRLAILYPEGRISDVQRRFMTTVGADNVRSLAVAGDFDDCQAMVKALFADASFARETSLAAVNSINFARIAAQIVYYFVAGAVLGAPFRALDVAVPTGNFGDAYAGWAARRMGLPICRITAATNANAIVARALSDGVYRRGAAVATQSPAMDIQSASNFERLHFEYAGRGNLETAAAFEAFAATGEIELPNAMRDELAEVMVGASASEDATSAAIRHVWGESQRLIDPHTAVAAAVARPSPPTPLVILSTAHPAKFPEAVAAATGVVPPEPPAVQRLAGLEERFETMAADAGTLKAWVRAWA